MKAIGKLLALVVILALFTIPTAVTTSAAAVENQPHMKEALEALRAARHHLEQAEADKGGHRVAALKACDDAIRHTEEGIAYANTH